jgi:succinate dehydrogenase flavin-adding protein (antitoxin of CptAB toxin-antitoxin module)
VNLFLDAISADRSLQGRDGIKQAFNRLLECSDLRIRKLAESVCVTPKTVSAKYIKKLIRDIRSDKCNSATVEDVLSYQEAVDELGRLMTARDVKLLVPLFSHKYWRVRKHAVMTAKIAAARIPSPENEELLSHIHLATQDPDDTVRGIAEQ